MLKLFLIKISKRVSSESKLDDELEDKLEDSVYKQLDYVEQRDVDP